MPDPSPILELQLARDALRRPAAFYPRPFARHGGGHGLLADLERLAMARMSVETAVARPFVVRLPAVAYPTSSRCLCIDGHTHRSRHGYFRIAPVLLPGAL